MMELPTVEIPALHSGGMPQHIEIQAGEIACVLIVDDNPSKLTSLAAVVSGMALEVVTASSGREALRQLLQRDFALILLDVNMPTMDGYETAQIIHSRPRSAHIPIIYITAEALTEEERFKGYTVGAVDWILSPIVPEILQAKIRVFVDLFYLNRIVQRQSEELKTHNAQLEEKVTARTAALTVEVAERKRAEERVTRLNRMYAVLSGINIAIVRIHDKQALLDKACRITVEYGELRMVWIGLLDDNGEYVTPVSQAGFEDGYLDSITLTTCAQGPNSCLLIAQALQESAPVVCNSIATDPRMARWREAALQRGYQSLVILPLHLDGKVIGLLVLYAAETGFFDTQEMGLLTEVAGDISFALDHLEKEKKLNYLAYYDALTGLSNRSLLRERLNQALSSSHRHARALAVLSVGLNRFKGINDSFGHIAGDRLLRLVATRLLDCVRDGDTVSHPGGAEFAVVLTDLASVDGVTLVTQKIIDALAEPFLVHNNELYVTCSIGIALHPKDGEDSDVLLKNATAAMSRAKRDGHNNVQFYSEEMNARVMERLTLEAGLRKALARQEFLVYYQPQVAIHSGEIIGMEALVRWQHPEQGLVPPDKFIPVAEESGLIVPLGEWVLRTACAQSVAWQAACLRPVRVAVNLSSLQFKQQDLFEVVVRALKETGLDPCLLELELTESMVMEDVEKSIATLNRFKAMGIELSIDDFGTGYSSLSYLKKFPINKLKIDQSFVFNISTDADDAAITKTVINMAHDLELRAIAEGVETEAQLAFLRLHHCDEIQGYLFSRPVPADVLAALLKEGRCLQTATAAASGFQA